MLRRPATRNSEDAQRYFAAYTAAIAALGQEARRLAANPASAAGADPVLAAPSISVKLSALHPRYEVAQRSRVFGELAPALKALAVLARQAGIGFTIDTEETDRLELSLDLFEGLALDPELADWNGLGLAVQAYQKRALPVLDWLVDARPAATPGQTLTGRVGEPHWRRRRGR